MTRSAARARAAVATARRGLVSGTVGALLCLWPIGLAAQPEEGPVSILVVDLQEAMSRSTAMASIQVELQQLRQLYQREFVALEQEFREIEQELVAESETLGEAALQERRRAFELRLSEAQHRVQDRRMALDRGEAEAVDRIRAILLDIVADVAADRDAQLVLARNQVIIVDQGLDITDEVVAHLNERLPTVDVDVDAN